MCGTPSPRGGGSKKQIPKCPQIGYHPPLPADGVKRGAFERRKNNWFTELFSCGCRLRSSLMAWFDENRSTKKAKQRPVPPHSHTATHPYTAACSTPHIFLQVTLFKQSCQTCREKAAYHHDHGNTVGEPPNLVPPFLGCGVYVPRNFLSPPRWK